MSVVTHTSVPASAASITVPTPTGELDIAAAYIAINRHRQLVAVRGQYRPPLDLRLRQHRQDHPGRWRGGAHPRHGAQIAARCRTGRGRRRADRGHGPGSIGGSLGGTAQLDGGRPGDPDGGRVTPDHQRRRRARADEPECGACGPAGRHGPGEHGRPWQRRYGFGKHRRRNRRRRAAQAQAHGRRDPAAARRAGPDGQSFAISHTDCVKTFVNSCSAPKCFVFRRFGLDGGARRASLSRRDVCHRPEMAMTKRRWAYRPAYMPTQVPSVQPESRRDRFILGPFAVVVGRAHICRDARSHLGVPCRVWMACGFWAATRATSLAT